MQILKCRCRKLLSAFYSYGNVASFNNKSSVLRFLASKPNFKFLKESNPGLKDFLVVGKNLGKPLHKFEAENVPYLEKNDYSGQQRKVFFEVYGCQMNVSDTEIVWSILKGSDYQKCEYDVNADVILLITCAIREGAETKIWNRLKHLHAMKLNRSDKKPPLQVAVLGCMAERLKTELLEKQQWVDVIAGPDSYKDLPRLLAISKHYGQSAVNVILSADETYADLMPVRINTDSPTSFVSIMRGCDNMCTYCIVPFTRGRERSRSIDSILNEVVRLAEQGVKEITLLGQNVNSFRDTSQDLPEGKAETTTAAGFKTVYKPKVGGVRFPELLRRVAEAVPETRIRFTSPHPKDFPDELLHIIREYPNVCKNLHLPAQSGNSNVLERMRRGYTREAYIRLVQHIRSILPNVSLSSDFICGFCGETEEEFNDTVTLIDEIKYNVAYLFAYSMRERTTAHRRFTDDVPEAVKTERLQRMVKAYRTGATELHSKFVGQNQLILVEGKSKRSENHWFGRNDANIKVIIPNVGIPINKDCKQVQPISPGDFVVAQILESNSQVLKGSPLYHSNLQGHQHNR